MDDENKKQLEVVEQLAENVNRLILAEERVLVIVEKLKERVDVNAEEVGRREKETQRIIDFIIKQQAQFTTDMQELREAQARAEEKWGGMWERTQAGINALLAAAKIQAHEIDGLTQAQANTNRQMAETTEKLNALIDVVERLISERRNGG